jgi:hypothetical protein
MSGPAGRRDRQAGSFHAAGRFVRDELRASQNYIMHYNVLGGIISLPPCIVRPLTAEGSLLGHDVIAR